MRACSVIISCVSVPLTGAGQALFSLLSYAMLWLSTSLSEGQARIAQGGSTVHMRKKERTRDRRLQPAICESQKGDIPVPRGSSVRHGAAQKESKLPGQIAVSRSQNTRLTMTSDECAAHTGTGWKCCTIHHKESGPQETAAQAFGIQVHFSSLSLVLEALDEADLSTNISLLKHA